MQWLSGSVWLKIERLQVQVSSAALRCVLEQDKLILTCYWFNPGRHLPTWLKNVDWNVKNQIKQMLQYSDISFHLEPQNLITCTCTCSKMYVHVFTPLDKSVSLKINFLISKQNVCCGCSKDPSQGDDSFQHKKWRFKLSIRKYSQFYATMFCFSGSMCITIVLQSMVTSCASNKRNCKSHCRPNAK